MLEYDSIKSPLGELVICATDNHIVLVEFLDHMSTVPGEKSKSKSKSKSNTLIQDCAIQLNEYFMGKRKIFNLPIMFTGGTTLQRACWEFLRTIPYAKTVSYQEEAAAIKNLRAVRAVGNANGRNPVAIIVPCHRVIGKNGSLTGYGGGIWRKEWLLTHEKDVLASESIQNV